MINQTVGLPGRYPARCPGAVTCPTAAAAVYASANLHFAMVSRRFLPLLVVHLPAPLDNEPPINDRLLWRLRGQGWGNPAALLRGGDLDCLARPTIDGALIDRGPVTVAFDGQVLFHGPVNRAPEWRGAARAAGGVPVLLTTAATAIDHLTTAAGTGLVVGAWARLFHRGTGVSYPALQSAWPRKAEKLDAEPAITRRRHNPGRGGWR